MRNTRNRFAFNAALFLLVLLAHPFGWAQDRFDFGELKGFTVGRGEDIINHLDQAFTVRAVDGIAMSLAGNESPASGVLIELRGPDGSEAMVSTRTRPDGTFRLKHVRAGKYVFKATWLGFQSVVGTIIVSANAEAHQIITIRMKPGV